MYLRETCLFGKNLLFDSNSGDFAKVSDHNEVSRVVTKALELYIVFIYNFISRCAHDRESK